jgi:hypothetical protein
MVRGLNSRRSEMPDEDLYVLSLEANHDAVVYPEFADSYIGFADGPEGVAVYDRDRAIATVARRDGCTLDAAAEWVDYNYTAVSGPNQPIWVDLSPSYVRDWLVPLRFLDVVEEG